MFDGSTRSAAKVDVEIGHAKGALEEQVVFSHRQGAYQNAEEQC
jgi:hypothetical protein